MTSKTILKRPELTPKERLETAVQRAGKAFEELTRTVEKATYTADEINKAFAFLQQVLTTSNQKALLSIATAKAANGGFSLDMDLPAEVISAAVGQPQGGHKISLIPDPAGRPIINTPEGRIVGTGGLRNPVAIAQEDDEDGVGFIDP
jgi:hypothetical protein